MEAGWVEAPGSAGAPAVQPDNKAASVNNVKPAAAVRRCRRLAVMVSPQITRACRLPRQAGQ